MASNSIKQPTVEEVTEFIKEMRMSSKTFAELIGLTSKDAVNMWRHRGKVPRNKWMLVNKLLETSPTWVARSTHSLKETSESDPFEEIDFHISTYIAKKKVEMRANDFEIWNEWGKTLNNKVHPIFCDKDLWEFLLYAIPRCSNSSKN